MLSFIEMLSVPYTFMNTSRRVEEAPFLILGIPLDETSSYRSGTRWAPASIRKISRSLEACSITTDINVESLGFADLGDIALPVGDVKASLNTIYRITKEVLQLEKQIFILGGEHTITYSVAKALKEKFGDICLVVFDAHLDLRDEYMGTKYNHATVMRRIYEEVRPSKLVIIGARAYSKEEVDFYRSVIAEDRLKVLRSKQIDALRLRQSIAQLTQYVDGCKALYISIDLDVLDPAYAPGVQTPEPLGLDPRTLLSILSMLVDHRIKVIDLVELTPLFDPSEITSALAVRLILELAAMMARSRSMDVESCWNDHTEKL